jgi:hypothetical protein
MAVIGSGDQSTPPDVALEPGRGYRYTLTLPIELSSDQTTFVVGLVRSILGAVATVGAVYTQSAGAGWTDLVIEFGT